MNLEYILIGINLFIFVISPFLPNIVYTHFVETYVGAVILLLLAFISITQGYLVAVSTFSSVGALYAESHARKAKNISSKNKATNEESSTLEQQLAPSPNLVPNEIHPDIEPPPDEKVTFVPKEEDSTNSFKPVGESINAKNDLPTTSFSKDAEEIYLKDNLAESSLRD
jgi:hypothetical protein